MSSTQVPSASDVKPILLALNAGALVRSVVSKSQRHQPNKNLQVETLFYGTSVTKIDPFSCWIVI